MKSMRALAAAAVLLIAVIYQYLGEQTSNHTAVGQSAQNTSQNKNQNTQAPSLQQPTSSQAEAVQRIRAAANDTDARFWITLQGTVIKNLKDDTQGSRHQKFLIEIANNLTLLIVHNIDLAPRIPTQPGNQVTVRGEYVWNNRGGLIHWTHHDPKGRRTGGWIKLNGQHYE